MPRFALLASLALAACTGDPAPLPQPDAAADVAAPPDAPQDAAPPPDLTPPADVAGPDSPPPPDAGPDTGPDVTADAAPDAPRDVAGEFADAGPDRADVPPPDPLLEQVAAVRVMVTGAGVSWVTARTQSCTVSSGRVSVGAEYDAPEQGTFVAEGPVAGPVVFGTAFNSDIRGTVRQGPTYLTDGDSVRRTNFLLRGAPRGTDYEMIALGCVVR